MQKRANSSARGPDMRSSAPPGVWRSLAHEAEPDEPGDQPEPTAEPDEPGEPSADPADPEPDTGRDAASADAEPAASDDEPPAWRTQDGDLLSLPTPVWLRWRRRSAPPAWPPGRGWAPRPKQRPKPGRRALDRLRRLTADARRIGTLRNRRSGAQFPVYRGRLGNKSYRIVARPRGGLRRELMLVRPEAAQGELEMEAFPLSASSARPRGAAMTRDGWRLHLPHARVHTILSRLHPAQVRRLAGGSMGADPGPAVAQSIRRLAARARRVGKFGPGKRLPVFAAAGYRLLVRPISRSEGEILMIRPPATLEMAEEISLPITARLRSRQKDSLRRAAQKVYATVYPRSAGKKIEVHHRVPLEWSHLFPQVDPNRISNLQGLTSRDHLRKASDLWTAFRNTYQHRRTQPRPLEVLRYAGLVDRSLQLPYPL